tara:strand:- start:335 stop:1051 length:717 start_codon:yes stop_codon:yes gene_type:complete
MLSITALVSPGLLVPSRPLPCASLQLQRASLQLPRALAPLLQERSVWPAMDDGLPVEMIHAVADAVFAELDTDKNGGVSEEELREYLTGKQEFEPELVTKVFTGIDFDKSGEISEVELRDAFVKYPTLRKAIKVPEPRSGWPAMDDDTPIETLHAKADALFAMIDTDGDGSISSEELGKHMAANGYDEVLIGKVFTGIDFDASGEIAKEELRDAFVKKPTLRTAPGLGGPPFELAAEA